MNITIERADLHNLDQIVPLFDGYRQFYGQPSDMDQARTFISRHLENGTSVIFLAFIGEQPCGMTQLYGSYTSIRMARIWKLNDLFVSVAARGYGVGTALLKRVQQFGEQTHAARVDLSTDVNNFTAQHLYEKFGFEKTTQSRRDG